MTDDGVRGGSAAVAGEVAPGWEAVRTAFEENFSVRHDLGAYRRDVQLVAVNANPVATSVADVRQWSAQHHMQHQ